MGAKDGWRIGEGRRRGWGGRGTYLAHQALAVAIVVFASYHALALDMSRRKLHGSIHNQNQVSARMEHQIC